MIRTLRAKNVQAIATAAVREAGNGELFIARAEAALGCRINTLSGKREAELAAQGIRMAIPDPDGIAGDLGGGSLELIDIGDGELVNAVTLPLGGLRLSDQSGGKLDQAGKLINASLKTVDWLANAGRGRSFYAVGGTWRSLAKLHMIHTDYPLRVMHHYEVPAKEMIAFCREVQKPRRTNAIAGYDSISKARRELLPFGAKTMEMLLTKMRADKVVFSVFGIREGLLYGFLPPNVREADPLLSFCEDYARLRSRSMVHAYELIKWTDPLFETGELSETKNDKRLRAAACLLSDIGWRAHPDYRGEQSLNVVAHAALTGIDHPGRLYLALSVYFRHAGSAQMAGEGLAANLRALAGEARVYRARVIAAAVRAAHMLSAGMAGVIDETQLVLEPGRLVLELPQAHADLYGERVERRFRSLGDLLERQTSVRITE